MGEGSSGDEDLVDLDDLPEGADDGEFVGQGITFDGTFDLTFEDEAGFPTGSWPVWPPDSSCWPHSRPSSS